MDNTIITLVTIALYIAVSYYQYQLCYKKQDDSQARKIAGLTLLPIIMHGWLLLQSINTDLGLNLSISNIFTLTFWLVSIVIIISSIKRKLGILVMVILPISGLALLVSQLPGQQYLIDASSPLYLSHILISIAAISIISLAAIQSLFVSLLDSRLKQHPAPPARGMPALQDMENFLIILIWTGFILLTLSLITAMLFFKGSEVAIPLFKSLFSIASWLVFAIFLIGRYLQGWRAKTVTYWAISGFALLFVAYFGTRLFI